MKFAEIILLKFTLPPGKNPRYALELYTIHIYDFNKTRGIKNRMMYYCFTGKYFI